MATYKPLPVKLRIPTRVQPEVKPPKGREGQYTNKMHYVEKHLLRKLGAQECAAPFMEPVDAKALNVPSYYTIIRNPMDLGTIIQRVENRYYRRVTDLIKDLQLVFSNCYTFNRPYSQVYRKGLQLEQLVLKVLDKIPAGEELPYAKKAKQSPELSQTQLQCQAKLKRLLDEAEQLEQPERDFFHDKWMELSSELEKSRPQSVEEFDRRVVNVLKQCRDQAKRIFQHFDSDPNQPLALDDKGREIPVVSQNVIDVFGPHDWPRFNPHLRWQDSVISALDHTVRCLKEALDNCPRDQKAEKQEELQVDKLEKHGVKKKLLKDGQRREQKQLGNKEDKGQDGEKGKKKEKETLTYKLGKLLMRAKISAQGKRLLQTNLADSSDDEEGEGKGEEEGRGEGQPDSVSVEERQALQTQFEKLSPESMREMMHMIEQSESRSVSNVDRKYDVMNLSRGTISLLKKAMDADKRPKTKGFKPPAKRGPKPKPKQEKKPPKLTLKQRRELQLKALALNEDLGDKQVDVGEHPGEDSNQLRMELPLNNPKGPAQYFQQ